MKALFVGLGSVGQRHLRNLRDLKGESVEILAWRVRGLNQVVTDNLEAEPGEDLQSRYGFRLVPTLEAGLSEKPDVTFVCNPSSLHVPVALAALTAGSHVFVEKPLSNNLDNVDTLIAKAERTGLVGYLGCQFRFHPAINCLQRSLETGVIGRILAVRAVVGEYLPNFHRYEDYRSMYAARRDLGGGVVLTQIHELDYLSLLFGMPRRVFAIGGHLSTLELDVEDVVALLLDCGTAQRPLPISVHMDYVQRPSARGCEVIGEKGKLVMDLTVPHLVHYGPDATEMCRQEWRNFKRNDMFVDELRQFVAACENREMPRCTLADGARTMRIALSALQSLSSGTVVEVVDSDDGKIIR
jgi:predicted dehydrogenase